MGYEDMIRRSPHSIIYWAYMLADGAPIVYSLSNRHRPTQRMDVRSDGPKASDVW